MVNSRSAKPLKTEDCLRTRKVTVMWRGQENLLDIAFSHL
jgi:hypothetical protein